MLTQAFILAGGRGDRLLPLTKSRPKPVISFGGVFRIVDFTLSNCLNSKIGRVSLLTQHMHEALHGYVRDSWTNVWNRSLGPGPICLPPTSGKRYRGTADAVFRNLNLVQANSSDHVLILSSDHVYQMDYRELLAQHVATNADATIAAVECPVAQASNFGVIEVDGMSRVTGFHEKPSCPRPLTTHDDRALVSMGVYAFKRGVLVRSLLEHCDRAHGYDFGQHVLPSLIRSSSVFAYNFRDDERNSARYWRDIGTIDGYYEASMELVQPIPRFNPYMNEFDPSQRTHHPSVNSADTARVHAHSSVRRSVLAPGVYVAECATVQDSVLMPGVHVGPGAWLRRVIVEEGVQIPAGFQIGWNADNDRRHFTISAAGVVVVTEMPQPLRSRAAAASATVPFERTVVA